MARNGSVAAVPEGAGELRERIEQWRRTRTKLGGRMPAELWEAAVELASRHGVYTITRAVGVEYSALKTRVEALGRGDGARAVAPTFVELRASSTEALAERGETMVELSDGGGARMTIRVGSGGAVDVAQVVSAFFTRAR